jgi:hypothetical protein
MTWPQFFRQLAMMIVILGVSGVVTYIVVAAPAACPERTTIADRILQPGGINKYRTAAGNWATSAETFEIGDAVCLASSR